MQAVFENLGRDEKESEKERFVAICHASLLQLTLARNTLSPIKIETELNLDPAFMDTFNHALVNQSTTAQAGSISHKAAGKTQTNLGTRLLQEMHHLATTYYHYEKSLNFSECPAAEANNLYNFCLENLRVTETQPYKQPLIASPSFTRMQRIASINQTGADSSSFINNLKEKYAGNFDPKNGS